VQCQAGNVFSFLLFPSKKAGFMDGGYRVKLQKVERPTNRSYYVNFPVALAEAMNMQKGEEFDWIIEDKNTLIFRRVVQLKNARLKNLP
jgi:hypothetical protein